MSLEKIIKQTRAVSNDYHEGRFTKSLQGNLKENGYGFNLNKQEVQQELLDGRQYLVLDITDKDMFTDLLPVVRGIHGYSQSELADKVGLHYGSISRYEAGRRRPNSYRDMRLRLFLTGTSTKPFNRLDN